MKSASACTTRPKSSAATKRAMLDAARLRFLQESYENVGLRDIAGDVGVDVALVSRYFGSKEELFREVLGVGRNEEILPPDLKADEMPAFLARLFIQQGDDGNEHIERLVIMLRSASSPAASTIVREALRQDVLEPFAERLAGDRAKQRASCSMAVWMGMTMLRTMMAIEPLCSREGDIEARMRQLFAAALAENPPG